MIFARPMADGCRRPLLLVLGLLLAGPTQAMTLTEALDAAVQNDPFVRQSLAQTDADREAGAEDLASRRPQLGVSAFGQYSRTESNGIFGQETDEYPSWGAQLEARQALFRLDWAARGDRAEALDALADAGQRQRTQQLLLRVADRYFGVLDAEDAVTQRRREAEALKESYEDARNRYEVELIPRTDLVEAQSRHDLAQAQLLTAERALADARDALEETTGHRPERLPRLGEDPDFPELEPAEPEEWVAAAMAQNPELIAQREQLAIAEADVRSSRAARMPELDLVARAGIDDSSNFQFGQRVDDQTIGVELSMPIYSGGQLAARERQAEALKRVNAAAVDRLAGEIQREAREAYRSVASARSEVRAFARALESAEAAEKATRDGYEAGTRTITDVLDATSRVAQARRDLNRSRYQLLLNLLQLRSVAGEIDRGDFRRIDALLSAPEPLSDTATPKSPS
jgi:TolC family type I secretion outer membrane protein